MSVSLQRNKQCKQKFCIVQMHNKEGYLMYNKGRLKLWRNSTRVYIPEPPLSLCIVGQLCQVVTLSSHYQDKMQSPYMSGVKDRGHFGRVFSVVWLGFWHTSFSKRSCFVEILLLCLCVLYMTPRLLFSSNINTPFRTNNSIVTYSLQYHHPLGKKQLLWSKLETTLLCGSKQT